MIYILDAAALLNNEVFSFEKENEYYTTSLVFSEWRDFRSKALAENALSSGLLKIVDPCPVSMQTTFDKCNESNTKMSDADASLVALSVKFREQKKVFVVVTDDYSIQNILKKLGIGFEGVAQPGIKRHRNFKKN